MRELGRDELQNLIGRLEEIRASLVAAEQEFAGAIAAADPRYRASARNLAHYLAFRRHDSRELQEQLAALGLSSLGRLESHVLSGVSAVLGVLQALTSAQAFKAYSPGDAVRFQDGERLLQANTQALFGAKPDHRSVYIMVTAPREAVDYHFTRSLVEQGVNCLRINCAHDGPEVWSRIAENVRRASADAGRECRVLMDLGGPKLRIGSIEPGPKAASWKPHRDWRGHVLRPARIGLVAEGQPAPAAAELDAVLPVPAGWLDKAGPAEVVEIRDLRGGWTSLRIVDRAEQCFIGHSMTDVYVASGSPLRSSAGEARVGELPQIQQKIKLARGDTLILRLGSMPGRPALTDRAGKVLSPAIASCSVPELFRDIREGESIWFNDGKIGGAVRSVGADAIEIRITHAKSKGGNLHAGDGINLPDTELNLSALGAYDIECLDFIARHADMVGLSFVSGPEDVLDLQQRLDERGAALGIVLKIETKRAFMKLPKLLLAALRKYPIGVMIARGDCAVECGYERMAEVQEEILWLCEAAHVPVVWATQVLESLTRDGVPSRAEVTDAAMAERAECVMLNKGRHILEAIATLDDILRRMQDHQYKKTARLRPLHLATP